MSVSKKKVVLNPFTGEFDLISEDNFSFTKIPAGKVVHIRLNQQMLVNGHVTVLGHLRVNGEMIDIYNRQHEQFFYDTIVLGDVVEVYENRLLLYKDHITVLGHLRVNGRLSGV